jgi:hypothetical protein
MIQEFLNSIEEFAKKIQIKIVKASIGEKGLFIINCSSFNQYAIFDKFKAVMEEHPEYVVYKYKGKQLSYKTVFSQCLASGLEEHALYLIEKGADVNLLASDENEYPILLAARRGLIKVIDEMIKKGVDLNVVDNFDHNILSSCLSHYDYNFSGLVQLLKKNNFDFNCVDSKNNNILFDMAEKESCKEEAVNAILNTNINLSHRNNEGNDFMQHYKKSGEKSKEFALFIEKFMLEKNLNISQNCDKKNKKQKI